MSPSDFNPMKRRCTGVISENGGCGSRRGPMRDAPRFPGSPGREGTSTRRATAAVPFLQKVFLFVSSFRSVYEKEREKKTSPCTSTIKRFSSSESHLKCIEAACLGIAGDKLLVPRDPSKKRSKMRKLGFHSLYSHVPFILGPL